ncbi:MAG: carbohydrate binding family 9 domain-containing protein [Cyclobacteriaceae bacterium]|nr:carbohydrate binding family 9 domain-containing protein [Cyclobacteriaceae bacterium]
MLLLSRILPCVLLVLALTTVSAQVKNAPGAELGIRKATGPIILDGKLDEEAWTSASVATNFFLNYPADTTLARFQTEARLVYDDHSLYISLVCYDNDMPNIVQSLRRDFDYSGNDNASIMLGPYHDGLNGFFFAITPEGVQSEGTIAAGGRESGNFNGSWDNKWYSKVIKLEDRWVAEIRIPFKSFRYKNGADTWDITFVRYDLKRNEVSSWIATPIQFIPNSFAYSGRLKWDVPPPHQTANISLIPYVAGGTSADRTTTPEKTANDLQAGFDAKVGVTPSLNLDITVNPDFSQVEVDRQVINLTRFEYQFPERRQFFLENSDLFDRAGWPDARPFFSRRVGLAQDTSGLLRKVPIEYGARLSGSLSRKWRTSLMHMRTKETAALGLPDQTYTAAAIQRNFWKQSSIQLTYVDKQSIGGNLADSVKYFHPSLWEEKVNGSTTEKVLNTYNRTATVDLDLLSADNKWYLSGYLSKSFDAFASSDNWSGGGFVQYTRRTLQFFAMRTFIQENFNAEPGYVPSRGVYPGVSNTSIGFTRPFYPESKRIVKISPQANVNLSSIPSGVTTDRSANVGFMIDFLNTANFQVQYTHTFQELTNSFNPIDHEKYTNFLPGEQYTWNNVLASYRSDQRKLLKYALGTAPGSFYNGTNLYVFGELNYRYQPYGSVSLRLDYYDVKLPGNYGAAQLFIASPRFDLTLTDKIFLTTFFQYNTRADNVNLNARLQWRYKPASDFFLVYTENYLPGSLSSKNYSLVFKFTYWLNI